MPSRYEKIIDTLIEKMKKYSPLLNEKMIREAYHLAADAHKNDFRRSGAPYIEHPVSVAEILSDLKVDDVTITAALLHDVVEDTIVSLEEIEEKFGKIVAHIVDGVTKISEIKFDSFEQKQVENYRKLVISMIKDPRVIIIKFADRLHNIRTIRYMPEDKQRKKALETMEVYAPLAYRLGMFKLKSELEDLAFEIINPEKFHEIKNLLKSSINDLEKHIEAMKPMIIECMEKNGISAKVSGRIKHYHAIYRKLQTRKDSFEQILDIIALRIILPDDEDCYAVLRIVHNLFRPVQGQFGDFIAVPKSNGYQSLHTKIFFNGKIVEIQIRTQKMHDIAENGLAAHWKYKNMDAPGSEKAIDDYIENLKNILKNSFESTDPTEVLEELKSNLVASGEIFVFTPKKELYILPRGSSTVDFAYRIHDNIGNHCIAAKVNGKILPLSSQLENGDVVEIITSQKQVPSHEWLKITKSAKARKAIKQFFKKNQYDHTIQLGKEILAAEILKYKLVTNDDFYSDLSNSFGFTHPDDCYFAIGQGEIKPIQFIRKIKPEEKNSLFKKLVNKIKFKPSKNDSSLKIHDANRSIITLATCCEPLPGDLIIGELAEAGELKIHRLKCLNTREIDSEKLIDVQWDTEKGEEFKVTIKVAAEDRKHLVLDIITAISTFNIYFSRVEMQVEDGYATGTFVGMVQNLNQYLKIRNKISSVKGVITVNRVLE